MTSAPGVKMAALDAGVPLRNVQLAARHAAYVVVAFVAAG